MDSRNADRIERAAVLHVLARLPLLLLALVLGAAFLGAVVWGGICGALGL